MAIDSEGRGRACQLGTGKRTAALLVRGRPTHAHVACKYVLEHEGYVRFTYVV